MSKLTAPIKIVKNTIGVSSSDVAREGSAPLVVAKSAYRLWLDAGNVGSLSDFFEFLTGDPGPRGVPGIPGPPGATSVNNANVNAAAADNPAATRAALNLGSLATQDGDLASYITAAAAELTYRPLNEDAYTHDQLSASATWLVSHNLGRFPAVTVVDSSGAVVVGDVVYISPTQLRVTFSAAFSGSAYFN